jgi:hypothetical protein
MSEEIMEATPAVEPKRRGRPRPQETLERDAAVASLLAASGQTINAIMEAFNASHPEAPVKRSLIYLAVCRLRKLGQVVKARLNGQYIWNLVAPVTA